MTETTAARDRCDRKMADLRKHVPFIEATIRHLREGNEKSRLAQLSKLESLHAMLTDANRKWKYPVLLRCEELIIKLKTRTESDVYADRSVNTDGGGDAKKSPEEIRGSKTRPIPPLGSKAPEDVGRNVPKRVETSAGNGNDKNLQGQAKITPVKKTRFPSRENPESSTMTTSTVSRGIPAKGNLQGQAKIAPVKSLMKDSGLLATTNTKKTCLLSRGNPESSTTITSAGSRGIPAKGNLQNLADIGVKSFRKDSGAHSSSRSNPESSTTITSARSGGIPAKRNLQGHAKIEPVKSLAKDSGLLATTDTKETRLLSRANSESSTTTTSAGSGGIPANENLQNHANPGISGKIIPSVVTSYRKAPNRSSRMPVVWRQCISDADHVTEFETIAAFPEDRRDRTGLGHPTGYYSNLIGIVLHENGEISSKRGRVQDSESTVLAGSPRALSQISPPGAFPIDLTSLHVVFPGNGEDSSKRGHLQDSEKRALSGSSRAVSLTPYSAPLPKDSKSLNVFPGNVEDLSKRGRLQDSERTVLAKSRKTIAAFPEDRQDRTAVGNPTGHYSNLVGVVLHENGEDSTKRGLVQDSERKVFAGSPEALSQTSPRVALPINSKSTNVVFPEYGKDSSKRGRLLDSEERAPAGSPRAVSLTPSSAPLPKDSKSLYVVFPGNGEGSSKRRSLQSSERTVLAGSPRAVAQTSPRVAFPINSKSSKLVGVVLPENGEDSTKLGRIQDSERTAFADLTQEARPISFTVPFPKQFKSLNTVLPEDGQDSTKLGRMQDSERTALADLTQEAWPISSAVRFPKQFKSLNTVLPEDGADSTKLSHSQDSGRKVYAESPRKVSPTSPAAPFPKDFNLHNPIPPEDDQDSRKRGNFERYQVPSRLEILGEGSKRLSAGSARMSERLNEEGRLKGFEKAAPVESGWKYWKSFRAILAEGGENLTKPASSKGTKFEGQRPKTTVAMATIDVSRRKAAVAMVTIGDQGPKSMVTTEMIDGQGQKSTVTMESKFMVTMETNDAQGQKSVVTMDTNDCQGRKSMVTVETNDVQGQKSTVTMETNDAQALKSMVTMETNDGYEQRGYSSTPLHIRNIKTEPLATVEIGETSSGTSKIGFQHKQLVGVVKRENAALIPSTRYGEGSRACTSVEILDFIVKNYKQIKKIFDSDDSEEGGGESHSGRRRRRKKKKKHKRRYSPSESSDDSEHRKRKKSAKQEFGVGEKSAKTEEGEKPRNDVTNLQKTETPEASTSAPLRRSDQTEMDTSRVKLPVASLKKRGKKPDGTALIQGHREIDATEGVSRRMGLRSNLSHVTSNQTEPRPSNGSDEDAGGSGRRTRSQSRSIVQRDQEEERSRSDHPRSNSASARDNPAVGSRRKSREPVYPFPEGNLSKRSKSSVDDDQEAASRWLRSNSCHDTSDAAAELEPPNVSDDEVVGKGRKTRSKSRRDQGQEEANRNERPRSSSTSAQDVEGRTSRQGPTLPVSPFRDGNLSKSPRSTADPDVAGRSSRKSGETLDAEERRQLPVSPLREGHLRQSPRTSADQEVAGRSSRKSAEPLDAEEGRTFPVSPFRKNKLSKHSRLSVKSVNDGQEVAAGEADRHFHEISIETNERKPSDMKHPDRVNAELGEIRTPPTGSPRKRRKKEGEVVVLQEVPYGFRKHSKISSPAPSSVTRATRGHHREGYYDVIDKRTPCELCQYDGPDISLHYKTVHPESEVLTSKLSPRAAEMAISRSKGGVYENALPPSRRSKFHQYACPFCDMIVWEVAAKFYDHLAEHTGEFKYGCGSCGYANDKLSEMDRHQDETHDGDRKLKLRAPPSNSDVVLGFLCSNCNYVQTAEEDLERHVQFYHKEKRAEIFKVDLNFIGLRENVSVETKMIGKSKRGKTVKDGGGSNATAASEREQVMRGNYEVEDEGSARLEEDRNPEETRGPIGERIIQIAPSRIEGGGAQPQSPPSLSNTHQSPHLASGRGLTALKREDLTDESLSSHGNMFVEEKSPPSTNGRGLSTLKRGDLTDESLSGSGNLCGKDKSTPPSNGRGLTPLKREDLTDDFTPSTGNLFVESESPPPLNGRGLATLKREDLANQSPPSNENLFAESQFPSPPNGRGLTALKRKDLADELPPNNECFFAEGDLTALQREDLADKSTPSNENMFVGEKSPPPPNGRDLTALRMEDLIDVSLFSDGDLFDEGQPFPSGRILTGGAQPSPSLKEEPLTDEDESSNEKSYYMNPSPTSSLPNEIDAADENQSPSSFNNDDFGETEVGVIFQVGLIELLRCHSGRISYGCLVPGCSFCSEDEQVFGTHCQKKHARIASNDWLCDKCGISFPKITLYELFLHVSRVHVPRSSKMSLPAREQNSGVFPNRATRRRHRVSSELRHQVGPAYRPHLPTEELPASPKFQFVITEVRSLARESDHFDRLSPSTVEVDDVEVGCRAKIDEVVAGPSGSSAPIFVITDVRSLANFECLSPTAAPSTAKIDDVQTSLSGKCAEMDDIVASPSCSSAPAFVIADVRSLATKSDGINCSSPTAPSTVEVDDVQTDESRREGAKSPDVVAGPSGSSAPPFVIADVRSLAGESRNLDCLSPIAPSTVEVGDVQTHESSREGAKSPDLVAGPSGISALPFVITEVRSLAGESDTIDCLSPTAPSPGKVDIRARSRRKSSKFDECVADPSRISAPSFVIADVRSLATKSDGINCLLPTAPSTVKLDDVQASGSSREGDLVAQATNPRSLLRKSNTVNGSPPTAPSTVKLDDVQASGLSRDGDLVAPPTKARSLLRRSNTIDCLLPSAPPTVKLDDVQASGSSQIGDLVAPPTKSRSLLRTSNTIDCSPPSAPSTVKLDDVQTSDSSRIGAFEFVVFDSSLLTEEPEIVSNSPEVTMKSENFDFPSSVTSTGELVGKWEDDDATPPTVHSADVTTWTSTGNDKFEAKQLLFSQRLRRINNPDDDDLELDRNALEFDEEADETAEGQTEVARSVFCKCPVFGCHFSTYDRSELFGHILRHGNRYISCLYCDKVPRLWQYTSHIMDKHFFLLMVPTPSRILPRFRPGKYPPLAKLVKPYSWVQDGCTFKTIFAEWIFKYRKERGAASCGYCSAPLEDDVDGHFATHSIHPHHCPYCRFGSSKANRVVRHLADCHEDLPFCLVSRFVSKNLPAHNSEYHQLSFLSDELIAARTSEMGLDTKRRDPPAELRLSTAPPVGGNESTGTAPRRRRQFRAPPEYKCGEDTTSASETEDVLRELIAADPEDAGGGATGKDVVCKRGDPPTVNDEMVFVDVIADRTTEELDADVGLVVPEEFRHKCTWRRWYKCPICRCAIKEPIKFYEHLTEEGGAIRKKYLDGATEEGDHQLRQLIEDIIRHQTRIMYYWLESYISCRFCSKTFYSNNPHYLISHEMRHLDGAQSFRCPLCEADYFAEGLFLHIHKTHWSNLPTPPPKPIPPIPIRSTYKPSHDDFFLLRTMTYSDLEGLRRYPTDKSPKTCAICLFEGSYREQVVHYAEEHPGKEVLGFAFRCTICRKYFDLARLFRVHNRERHASEAKASTTYVGAIREKCTVCGERFDDRTVLRSHFRTHTEPYMCKHCDHRTYNLRSLRKHYCERHEGESFDFLFDFAAEKVGRTRRVDETE